MLHIVNGPPDKKTPDEYQPEKLTEKGTTTSTFILPFRYQITPENLKNPPDIYYKETDTLHNNKQWTERRRYFSRETSCVLFEHSKRFEINTAQAWAHSDNRLHPKTIEFRGAPSTDDSGRGDVVYRVNIEPPEIILFEYANNETDKSTTFQTGFLIINTWFSDNKQLPTTKFEHLLHFNERFRYWRKNHTEHERELRELSNLTGGRENLSPEEESLELYIRRWQRLLSIPFSRRDNDGRCRYYQFIPDTWRKEAENWFLDEIRPRSQQHKHTGWITYNDTRAFVYTNAVVEGGSGALQPLNTHKSTTTEPQAFGHWVKLLNIDTTCNSQWWLNNNDLALNNVSDFEANWAKEKTYKRWAHRGTLYGFNYHACAMLSAPRAEPPLSRTFQRHYFDMTLLLLYLRISIFRFSRAMNESTVPAMSDKKNKKWEDSFLKLRKEFAFFTNLYQFPLISNQQQMLEMYQIARKSLDIDELFKEVEDEIKNTHEYFSIEESKKLNRYMKRLSFFGFIIATSSLIIAIITFFSGK